MRLLARLEEPGTWKRLVCIAGWSTKDKTRAKDLVSECVVRGMDPDDLPWDGELHFLQFMKRVFRHVFAAWMRRRMEQEVPFDATEIGHDEVESAPSLPGRPSSPIDTAPSPEEVLDEKRRSETISLMARRLREELARVDPLARQCLALWSQGLSVRDLAAELGCGADRVEALQALIRRRAALIKQEQDASDRARMLAARRAATSAERAEP